MCVWVFWGLGWWLFCLVFRKLSLQCHAEVCLAQLSCLDCSLFAMINRPGGDGDSKKRHSSNYTLDYTIFHYHPESMDERSEVVGALGSGGMVGIADLEAF